MLAHSQVEHLRPVGRREGEDAAARVERVGLCQERIDDAGGGLEERVIAPQGEGVELVEEDGAWRGCAGMCEDLRYGALALADAMQPTGKSVLDETRAKAWMGPGWPWLTR